MNRIIKQVLKENKSVREEKLKAVRKKLFIRFFASLALTAALFSVVFVLSPIVGGAVDTQPYIPPDVTIPTSPEAVEFANPDTELAPNESSVLYDLIGIDASQPLEILLLITIISVAPSILLMMTSFTRIIIVMSFLRNAMQTQQTPPNMVLTSLALFLTMFLMWPVFGQINETAYKPYADGEITTMEALERAGDSLKTFMMKNTSKTSLAFFLDLADATIYAPETYGTENSAISVTDGDLSLESIAEQVGLHIAIPAFMVSELSRAFQMAFFLFVPFLIIDIVVASTLMSMGMMMLPPAMISMPFKIMLFVLVDGWQLLIGSIMSSFNL
ncbi:MAG: flagellar type III secretion system pore protein FliP [Oscillospiraceae bacterium]|nr:flagellar type III secretion system pore protein FliP [Oscillospiraceae bacterium]